MGIGRHPSDETLGRFADGQLLARRHRRVAGHLAECPRCRGEVTFIRKAGELARSLEARPAPDGALEEILRRRAAGERVLLPMDTPGVPAPKRRGWVPAAAALFVLVAVSLFFRTTLLEADRSTLRITPAQPQSGDILVVEYDAGLQFAGQDYLLLRAQYNARSGARWNHIAATLTRGDGGVYGASVALPDSAVHAQFAIESLDGEHFDLNNGSLWDVVTHDAEGRPTLDGLFRRWAERVRRGDQLGALATGGRMLELYPESARALMAVRSARAGIGTTLEDDLVDRERVVQLARRLVGDPAADPDELAFLAPEVFGMGDPGMAETLLERAQELGASSEAMAWALPPILRYVREVPPAEGLVAMETLWRQVQFPVPTLADAGYRYAIEAADWDAATEWAVRRRSVRSALVGLDVLDEIRDTFGAARALAWAAPFVDETLERAQASRPLHVTPWQHARTRARYRQVVSRVLAEMALAAGQDSTALAWARGAVELSWETADLQALGQVLLAGGDTAAAVEAYARAAADPETAAEAIPDVVVNRAGWATQVERARVQLTDYAMAGSVVEPLPDGVVPSGQPVVVAFLLNCESRRRVDALAARVRGASVVAYYGLGEDESRDRLGECPAVLPIQPDPEGEVRSAFGLQGLPAYFVTDGDGRIRFRSEAQQVLRQLRALTRTTRTTVAD